MPAHHSAPCICTRSIKPCPAHPPTAAARCHRRLPRPGLFEFGCAVGLFAPIRPELGVAWYRTQLCAGEPGALRMLMRNAGALPMTSAQLMTPTSSSFPVGASRRRPPQARDALIRAHGRGARIASICSGAFVLAWAGCSMAPGHNQAPHRRWRRTHRCARGAVRRYRQHHHLRLGHRHGHDAAHGAQGLRRARGQPGGRAAAGTGAMA